MGCSFIDLGAGYFAYEGHGGHVRTVVLDSLAREPDHFFGPAAWGGEHGPHAGKRVCEAVPTRVGHYDQVSEHEWKWCMPDGTELDVEPPSWPRRVSGKKMSLAPNMCGELKGFFIIDATRALGSLAKAAEAIATLMLAWLSDLTKSVMR